MNNVDKSAISSSRAAWVTPKLSELDVGQTLLGSIPQAVEGLIIGSNPQVFGQS